jgi:hypothetical protein
MVHLPHKPLIDERASFNRHSDTVKDMKNLRPNPFPSPRTVAPLAIYRDARNHLPSRLPHPTAWYTMCTLSPSLPTLTTRCYCQAHRAPRSAPTTYTDILAVPGGLGSFARCLDGTARRPQMTLPLCRWACHGTLRASNARPIL